MPFISEVLIESDVECTKSFTQRHVVLELGIVVKDGRLGITSALDLISQEFIRPEEVMNFVSEAQIKEALVLDHWASSQV